MQNSNERRQTIRRRGAKADNKLRKARSTRARALSLSDTRHVTTEIRSAAATCRCAAAEQPRLVTAAALTRVATVRVAAAGTRQLQTLSHADTHTHTHVSSSDGQICQRPCAV